MSAQGIESLYPFLYEDRSTPADLLEQVRRSTEEKAREIVELRERAGKAMLPRLIECALAMARTFQAKGKLLTFGNGGSSTDAQSMSQLFLHPPYGQPFPAFSLTNDIAVITALSNDVGFDVVFARQIGALGKAGDIAAGFSTSGNSANVIRALEEARRRGLLTIGFAGYDGGKMAEAEIDYLFVAPSDSIHRIQETQSMLCGMLWGLTQKAAEGKRQAKGKS
jgi:D-sedoheptulose 7-phosphate isomerase